MAQYRLDQLEAAVIARNPLLATRLRPPLSEAEIKTMLEKAKVIGAALPVVALYSWRNGTIFDQPLMSSKTGFFPAGVYQFIDLERAIQHMKSHDECIFASTPSLAGRYLPVFWNGANNWVALDLRSSKSSVALIRFFVREASLKDGRYEPEIPETGPPREAYRSFEEFIADAIRANRENSPLTCFRNALVTL
jgi:hypothetical protein